VWRLCSAQRIFSVHARKRASGRKPGPPGHDDLVDRDFTTAAPNLLWLTDITEHPTGEGKLYLCAIKDCYGNRIVGYSMADRMTSELAVAALRNAVALRTPAGTVVVHSDRGSPVPVPQVRRRAHLRWPGRLDGPGRRMRGQLGHGVVLLAAAEERPEPSTVGHARTTTPGDRDLDRTDLPPAPSATGPRPAYPGRV
jgi:putative transposase